MQSGDVLDLTPLGLRVEVRRTAAETGGRLFEVEMVGRARGFVTEPHVHLVQEERFEVLEGGMELRVDGRTRVLGPGEVAVVPPGAVHRQRSAGSGQGRIRLSLRPAGDGEAFFGRLADLSASGGFLRGYPRPVAAAEIVRDFGASGHAARPPLPVQRMLARAVLAVTSREYVFVDEWDVAAPQEAVFAALSDMASYPVWWRRVHLSAQADGPVAIGSVARQHFTGRLPYTLRTTTRVVELERPRLLAVDVDGHLRGHGRWTLTPTGGGTRVRFDWQVDAERLLLRVLTPLLRPALRRNHAWAIARAREGLEPYALELAQAAAGAPAREAQATR